jgi:hypothetical protein
MIDLQPASRVGHPYTVIVVDILGWGLFGALILFCIYKWARARRWARNARRAEAGGPLHLGPAAIEGVVVADESPVAVEVEQLGSERLVKGSWSHSWTETTRRIVAHPFHVRRADGELVRVDGGPRITLADPLQAPIRVEHAKRVLRATIEPNARVHILGNMTRGADEHGAGGGYRTAAQSWILQQPLILSSAPLAARHMALARRWRNAGIVYFFMLAALQLGYQRVNVLAWSGRHLTATVTDRQTWQVTVHTKNGSHLVDHYRLDAVTPDGDVLVDETNALGYHEHPAGARVPFLVGHGWVQIGEEACASVAQAIIGVLVAVFLSWIPILFVWVRRPWWERRVTENGSGRLK